MTLELLRAFTKAGNYVGGAFDGDRLVGACVGFFHAPAEDALHSHIAGVVAGRRPGAASGFALKLHQRAWALLRGVSEIAWTFDPLVSRNAYFNLVKLGRPAGRVPAELLRRDARHHQRRRRLRPAAGALAAARPRGRRRVRRRQRAGGASPTSSPPARSSRSASAPTARPVPGASTARPSLVAVPADIEALRAADPALAQRWRVAVREALAALVADGGRITGFDRAGWYVVRRDR